MLAVALLALGGWLVSTNLTPDIDDVERLVRVEGVLEDVTSSATSSIVSEGPDEVVTVSVRVRYAFDGETFTVETSGTRRRSVGGRGSASAPIPVPDVGERVDLLVDRAEPSRAWLPAIGDLPPDLEPAQGSFLLLLLGGVLVAAALLGFASALLPTKPDAGEGERPTS